jgi:hypothetical protein
MFHGVGKSSLSFAWQGMACGFGGEIAESTRDAGAQLFAVDGSGMRFEQNENVQGWQAPTQAAKSLAQQALELVAAIRFPCNAFADCEAKTRLVGGVGAVINDEPCVVVTVPGFEKGRKIR